MAKIQSQQEKMNIQLRNAAHRGDIRAIKKLIQDGAQVNGANKDEHTALMYAAVRGDARAIEALVKVGANLEATDKRGKTALYHAAMNGNVEAVEELIKRGADLNSRNVINETILDALNRNMKNCKDPEKLQKLQQAQAVLVNAGAKTSHQLRAEGRQEGSWFANSLLGRLLGLDDKSQAQNITQDNAQQRTAPQHQNRGRG